MFSRRILENPNIRHEQNQDDGFDVEFKENYFAIQVISKGPKLYP